MRFGAPFVGISRASFHSMFHRIFLTSSLLVLGLLALPGCPGTISADGVDGFTVNSAHWMVYASGGARVHELVATNVGNYCSKRRAAEAQRQAAFEDHQARIADGMNQCESQDAWYDDLATAFNPIDKSGASYLRVTVAREVDTSDLDAVTAPAAGSYVQLGGGADGSFVASLQTHEARFNQQFADAWDCTELDEADMDDIGALATLLAQSSASVDYPQNRDLSAAQMDIVETSTTKREIDLDGDILEDGSTIGGIDASFTATQCEVELADEVSF